MIPPDLAQAKAEGWAAGNSGEPKNTNPYTGSKAAFWLEGWHIATGSLKR